MPNGLVPALFLVGRCEARILAPSRLDLLGTGEEIESLELIYRRRSSF